MKKVLVGVLAVIGALAILCVFMVAALAVLAALGGPSTSVPGRVILEVDFEAGVIEAIPNDPFARIMLDENIVVRDVVDALDRAVDDDRVTGVIARIGGGGVGLAHTQEIRDALERFRASGKPTVAWAETFGEFSAGNIGYYLATAFDEVYMQPSGDIGLTGLVFETMFMRGTLDKLDVEPAFDQRYEYKNAVNTYTHTEYTDPHREAMQSLIDSAFDQIVRGIADRRGMDVEDVRNLVDQGPFLGDEAIEQGLVDGLEYRDGAYERVLELAGKRSEFLFLETYVERAGRPNSRKGTTVALIHGTGGVMRGPGGFSPIDGSIYMGSDSVTRNFRAAIDNDRVEAIVFRVGQPRRFLRGLGYDLARDRACARGRQAGDRIDGQHGRLRRLLRCDAGGQDRRAARYADRVDRRLRRQDGDARAVRQAGHELRLGPRRRELRAVEPQQTLRRRRARTLAGQPRPHLSRLHAEGRRRPRHGTRRRARDCQGPRVDRRAGLRERARRCPGWHGRGPEPGARGARAGAGRSDPAALVPRRADRVRAAVQAGAREQRGRGAPGRGRRGPDDPAAHGGAAPTRSGGSAAGPGDARDSPFRGALVAGPGTPRFSAAEASYDLRSARPRNPTGDRCKARGAFVHSPTSRADADVRIGKRLM